MLMIDFISLLMISPEWKHNIDEAIEKNMKQVMIEGIDKATAAAMDPFSQLLNKFLESLQRMLRE